MSAGPAPQPATVNQPTQRWAGQHGFFDRRQPAFWLFVVLLVFTGLSLLTEQMTMLDVFPAGWLFSVVLLTLYVVPVALAIYFLDLYEREPLSLMVAAFLWGGVIAIGFAGPINTAWIEIIAKTAGVDVARLWGPALVAPPVEETLKLLGVATIYLIARHEMDDLIDGFVYGALVGLGFAAVENVFYFMQAIAGAGGGDQVGPVIRLYLLRVVFAGPYMHVLWSGLAGLGLAYYVTQRHHPHQRRLLVFAGLFLAAIAAHMAWNSPLLGDLILTGPVGWLLFGLIKGSPFFIFLFLIVRLAHQREHHWFQQTVSGHLHDDVLSQAEVAELGGLRSRWRARREMGRRKGPAGARLKGQLQREQIKLALVRSRLGTDEDPEIARHVAIIRSVRSELDALPDVAPPGYAAPYAQPTAPAQQASTAQATAPAQPTTAASADAVAGAPPPPPPPAAAAWMPTHLVPAQGMAAWAAPDPNQPPVATLPGGVQLRLLETLGAWGRVDASNGWSGWVDARLLLPHR